MIFTVKERVPFGAALGTSVGLGPHAASVWHELLMTSICIMESRASNDRPAAASNCGGGSWGVVENEGESDDGCKYDGVV